MYIFIRYIPKDFFLLNSKIIVIFKVNFNLFKKKLFLINGKLLGIFMSVNYSRFKIRKIHAVLKYFVSLILFKNNLILYFRCFRAD